jgi:FolB domain-containing protein
MRVKNYFQKNVDSISIEGFHISCRVGHTAQERSYPQIVTLNMEIYLPLKKAGRSDNMRDTVDYAKIITQIQRVLKKRSFVLIESLAETVAALTLRHPQVEAVRVRATKNVFENIDAVGAQVYREKTAARS